MQTASLARQEAFTVEEPAASSEREQTDGRHRPATLETVIGELLICIVIGSLLLPGCNRGISHSDSNEQAAANTAAESESDQRLRAQSVNNLKQIALALNNYHDTYKAFPAAVQIGPKDVPHSWRISILPFLESFPLYERYRLDEPWDSEHNKTLLPEMPAVLRAPDAAPDSFHTSYLGACYRLRWHASHADARHP
jgi:hypothetical protein